MALNEYDYCNCLNALEVIDAIAYSFAMADIKALKIDSIIQGYWLIDEQIREILKYITPEGVPPFQAKDPILTPDEMKKMILLNYELDIKTVRGRRLIPLSEFYKRGKING